MTTCPSCLRAQQIAMHRAYVRDCIGCSIRALAHMTKDEQEWHYDLWLRTEGKEAERRVRWDVRVEVARIRALRGGPANKERE